MTFLDDPPRQLFFTGKGGVGKTSIACASAIALADAGRRVLLVCTDPASNLDEVLGVTLGDQPTSIALAPGLAAMNLDPEAAARAYRERIVGPFRGRLPPSAIASMEEQLSGACTVEIAAFDEFAKLLGDPAATREFDHVLFDTAPTGHTLRLLSLPSAWDEFARTNTSGASCIGPLAGLSAQRALYEATIRALRDPAQTRLVLVTRAERSALVEAERTRVELSLLGVGGQHLVMNALFRRAPRHSTQGDPIADALEHRTREALAALPPGIAALPRTELPLAARALVGVAAIRRLLDGAGDDVDDVVAESAPAPPSPSPTFASLIDAIESAGRGVVLTVGKGGVGKTTIAAAIAVELSSRGHRVHLTTTDPAAHLAATVGDAPRDLTVSRIDPEEETRAYVGEVLATAGAGLDAHGRALLEEDLRSPCTEEVAVFRAFARTVEEGEAGFVVLDTAPTGHTLLLLDAAEAYHREVLRQGTHSPDDVKRLLPRLRDANFTRIVVVTLPEATPVHEAARLQEDLRRAGIEPFAWVMNQCLSQNGERNATRDPTLVARRRLEARFLAEVASRFSTRMVVLPWICEPPVGVAALSALVHSTSDRQAD